MTKRPGQLTAAEARTAFYLTFDRLGDRPPVAMSYLRKGPVQQHVVDRAFKSAGPAYLELRQAVSAVVARAQKQDRRIVAWHQHDLDIVRGLTNEPGLVRGFEARFVEGHAVAARWAARSGGPGAPARDDLEPYLALVGYSVPRFAGPGVVEPAIRNVGSRLAAGQDLDASQVQAWSDLLAHQRYACEGLRHLCVRAATELERLDQRSRKARKGRKKRRPAKPAS